MDLKKIHPIEKRNARPQALGGAFGGLMRIIGGKASDADLVKRWDEIMGSDISKLARLTGISKTGQKTQNGKTVGRIMTVKATVPAYATTLSYRTGEIMAKVNKYFGYDAIGKIVIRR